MHVSASFHPRVTLRNVTAAVVLAALLVLTVPAAAMARNAAPTESTGRILVQFRPGASAAARSTAIASAGAANVKSIGQLGVEVLRVPVAAASTALERLRRNPNVVYAEADATTALAAVTPNDPYYSRQWSPAKTRATSAWELTTGSASTVVAVLDTGVSSSHPELQGQLVAGHNVLTGTANAEDDHGHGTQSAGVIAALTNNAAGVASYCWKCKIMPVKVSSAAGTGYQSDLAAGITWATDHGAKVISMSLSGASGTATLASAVQYAANRGVVLVAAAGNDGTTTARYPAAYSEVIGVAGSDTTDTVYSWSNYGSWVDVAAPGVNTTTNYTGGYANYSGTSSATPVVAGVAALAFSYDASATGTEVRSAIQNTAVPTNGVRYGRVDAYATVTSVGSSTQPAPEPTATPTPTPTPTATPSPEPTATPAPAPMITTSTFTGSFNGKNPTRTHTLSAGDGSHDAEVRVSKSGAASLYVYDSSGRRVVAATGDGTVRVSASLAAGSYTYEVTGPSKASYTLTVTHGTP